MCKETQKNQNDSEVTSTENSTQNEEEIKAKSESEESKESPKVQHPKSGKGV